MLPEIIPTAIAATEFQLPPGQAWTAARLSDLLHYIANFLIAIGVVAAVIAFVSAGILYFASGLNAKAVEKGKELFKNALIGTLIVLAVGVIINTIAVLVAGGFFAG